MPASQFQIKLQDCSPFSSSRRSKRYKRLHASTLSARSQRDCVVNNNYRVVAARLRIDYCTLLLSTTTTTSKYGTSKTKNSKKNLKLAHSVKARK